MDQKLHLPYGWRMHVSSSLLNVTQTLFIDFKPYLIIFVHFLIVFNHSNFAKNE